MRSRFLLLPLTSCLVLLAVPIVRADKLVVTRSVATKEYLQKRVVDGKRQRQTYVFMPGRYTAGNTFDNSLHKFSFMTLAERLALDLRQQDFYPAESLPKADLLLVVHWGVTAGRNRDSVSLSTSMDNLAGIAREAEETQRELEEARARVDSNEVIRLEGLVANLENETRSENRSLVRNQHPSGEDSAGILGLTAELLKDDGSLFGSERKQTLYAMTQEERYFVIVMAYDAPTLIKTKRLKRVWTMRASISSAGVNFPQAVDRMANIASRYFGTNQENVGFDYTGDRKREESVKLGELVVLGTAER